jgi:poly-beta-hydroxyalkanoate depolymerase
VEINTEQVTVLTLSNLESDYHLDPVTVIFQNFKLGRGKVIIECYSRAWAMHWGAMGERTVQKFVVETDNDYLVDKLGYPFAAECDKAYLGRIVQAVKDALNEVRD